MPTLVPQATALKAKLFRGFSETSRLCILEAQCAGPPMVFLSSFPTEYVCRTTSNLLSRNVTYVLSKPPTIPKWVNDLPITVAPELFLQWLQDLGTCIYGTFPKGIDVFSGEVEDDRSATDSQR